MVESAGWQMPLLYAGILDEHKAARTSAAVFDVSHLGRLRLSGDWAFKLLDRACTADVLGQEDNTARYSLLCNDGGGVIDDVFVIRLPEEWLLTCNACNHEKVLGHLASLNELGGWNVKITDTTASTAMLAVQGPKAMKLLGQALPFDVSGLGRRDVLASSYMLLKYVASRTGYTGETGVEVILPAIAAGKAWQFITSETGGVVPAGMGARDLLRIEAGLPLYGHELNEQISPIAAGVGFAVRTEGDYVGSEAIAKVRRTGPARKLVGLRLATESIARHGSPVLIDDREAGAVTSGTYSPSCEASIAMAYVDSSVCEVGGAVSVEINPNERVDGEIVPRPFHRGSAMNTLV